jgi:uncharacterized protein (DUF2236 family)
MLAGGAIEVTDTARALAREVLAPPVPYLLRPALRLAALPAVGLLPPAIRAGYGLRWDARHARALAVVAAISRRGLPLMPSRLRYWAAARCAIRPRRPR